MKKTKNEEQTLRGHVSSNFHNFSIRRREQLDRKPPGSTSWRLPSLLQQRGGVSVDSGRVASDVTSRSGVSVTRKCRLIARSSF